MAFKSIVALYQSKNDSTGLTTVKAQVYKNGSAVAVGASAISLTEMDATNAPGIYVLNVPSSTLVTLGFTNGDVFEAQIDSSTIGKSAPAPYKEKVTSISNDDIFTGVSGISTTLGTPAGASVSADLAAIKSDSTAIKTDLESGAASLSTILSNIQSLQNGSISNGVGFVLPQLIKPNSGSNPYRIPVTIMDNTGALIDPTSDLVTVQVLSAAGTDRGAYLTGSSGTPAQVAATKDSTGQYHAVVSLPSTAPVEELIFSFSYQIGTNSMVRFGVSEVVTDLGASGFALQSTLLAVQSDVSAIKSDVEDATNGLANIESQIADGTFGLSALQALLTNGTYGLAQIQTMLANGTYGLSALKTAITGNLTEITSNVEGTGFSSGTDSLHQISLSVAAVQASIFTGGRAV